MAKKIKNFIAPAFVILIAVFVGFAIVKAENGEDIVFPVAELGNCQNETECRAYCDDEENITFCVDFTEKHNLMSKEEISKARAFAQSKNRPGNCKNKEECEAYCEDIKNIDSCLSFAEENGFIGATELKEAKQVVKALKEGANLPGGCKNKKECEAYCENTDHIEECVAFAEKAGFMSGSELEEAKKAAKAIKSGIKPPGNCKGKVQCDAYCSDSSHMEECLNFAEAAGFIPKEEAEMARKIMPLMMKGEMPGGCKSKDQCESYCENESRAEECASFAIKAGFMSQEEYEIFKKTGGKGPGGCKGRDECEEFCENPENQETCFNFGKEHGLIPEEKLKEMEEGREKIKEAFFEDMMPKMRRGGEEQEGMGGAMQEEMREMMEEKIKNEMMGGTEGGDMEEAGFNKEEIEKNIREKIEQETRQKIEEEIKKKMMGEFNL